MKNSSFHSFSIFLLIIGTLASTPGIASGAWGQYYLAGTATTHQGELLRNTQITCYFKNKVETIQTDSLGNYKLTIDWASPCPNGGSAWKRKKESKRINPDYIVFTYQGIQIKVKNDWQKYISSEDKILTKNENLIF